MTSPLILAPLAWRDNRTPYSPLFDDVYHSESGGVGQARHVFLGGNGLPARWSTRPTFTIVETGFGLGLNFLTTWAAWRADPAKCERLHFVSIEKHPFSRENLVILLARLASEPALEKLARQLTDAWPLLVPGLHHLEFETGRVVLTLGLGDVADVLPKLWLRADAFYLDGFAPEKNPAMWALSTLKALTRLADDGATLATYSAAGGVKQALRSAGFEIHRAAGFERKFHMLTGRFAPPWRMRRHEPPARPSWPERHAIVIGAGLAGSAIAERLAARGWDVTLFEQQPAGATQASGNPAGVFHPLISRDDSRAARVSRAGFFHALQRWGALAAAGHGPRLDARGLVQVAGTAAEEQVMIDTLAAMGCPAGFAVNVSNTEAAALTGKCPLHGGWFFPQGGWIDPRSLCAAQLASAGAHLRRRFGQAVVRLARHDGYWHAIDATGLTLASAPVVIVANAGDAARLAALRHAPTRIARGQLSLLPPGAVIGLSMPLIGDGYIVPLADGHVMAGASYDLDDLDPTVRFDSHADNLHRLGKLVPALAARFDGAAMLGRVAFRCVASDRLPLIGQLADEAEAAARATELAGAWPLDLPRQRGLYGAFGFGSRGLLWAALGAELIAAQINGEPWPVERDLADGIDPARFLLRALRHGQVGLSET